MRTLRFFAFTTLVVSSSAAACDGASDDLDSQSRSRDDLRRSKRPKDGGVTQDSATSQDSGTTDTTSDASATDAGNGCGPVQLGANASLGGARLFPDDDPWNEDISGKSIDPSSAAIVARMGSATTLHPDFGTTYDGAPNFIPYVVVGPNQAGVAIRYTAYGDESDPGRYPVPAGAPIEGGPSATGDRHVLVVQCSSTTASHLGGVFELFAAYAQADGSWNAASGAKFDPNSNALRPAGWTSADAAGLPVFAGLVRYDEVVEQRAIKHALRFTVSQSRKAYVAPARHFASSLTDANLPPMGMRMRLKASFDVSSFPASTQVILNALKRYGMFLADNGSSGYISGAPDPRWSDSDLGALRRVTFADFDVVTLGTIVTQ